jgi:hypothetical protein
MLATVYLGGYDKEEKAARAYDLAALKYWGPSTTINFPVRYESAFGALVWECFVAFF